MGVLLTATVSPCTFYIHENPCSRQPLFTATHALNHPVSKKPLLTATRTVYFSYLLCRQCFFYRHSCPLTVMAQPIRYLYEHNYKTTKLITNTAAIIRLPKIQITTCSYYHMSRLPHPCYVPLGYNSRLPATNLQTDYSDWCISTCNERIAH